MTLLTCKTWATFCYSVLCTNMAVSSRREYHTDQLDSVKGFLSLTVALNYQPGRLLSSLCALRDLVFFKCCLDNVCPTTRGEGTESQMTIIINIALEALRQSHGPLSFNQKNNNSSELPWHGCNNTALQKHRKHDSYNNLVIRVQLQH